MPNSMRIHQVGLLPQRGNDFRPHNKQKKLICRSPAASPKFGLRNGIGDGQRRRLQLHCNSSTCAKKATSPFRSKQQSQLGTSTQAKAAGVLSWVPKKGRVLHPTNPPFSRVSTHQRKKADTHPVGLRPTPRSAVGVYHPLQARCIYIKKRKLLRTSFNTSGRPCHMRRSSSRDHKPTGSLNFSMRLRQDLPEPRLHRIEAEDLLLETLPGHHPPQRCSSSNFADKETSFSTQG